MTAFMDLLSSSMWINALLFLSFLYACWLLLIKRLPVPTSNDPASLASPIDRLKAFDRVNQRRSLPHKLVNSSSVDDLNLSHTSTVEAMSVPGLKVPYFDNLVGKVWKKQKRKRRSLVGKTFTAAVNKIRERQQYNKVTKQTIHGDGLKSIFADYSAKDAASMNVGKESIPMMSPSAAKIPRNLSSFSEVSETYTLLRANDIYAWMPDPVLRSLSKLISTEEIPKGTVMYQCSDHQPAYTFVVLSGRVDLSFPHTQPSLPKNDSGAAVGGEEGQLMSPSPMKMRHHPKKRRYRTLLETSTCDFHVCPTEGSGLLETLASITKQQGTTVSTAIVAEEGTNIVKIGRDAFEALFEMYQGFREEFVLRIMVQLQRVTFTTIYSLTGFYVLENPDISDTVTALKPSLPSSGQSADVTEHSYRLLSKELGVSVTDLRTVVAFEDWYRYCEEERSGEKTSTSTATATEALADEPVVAHIIHVDGGTDLMDISDEPALYIVISGKLKLFSFEAEDDNATDYDHDDDDHEVNATELETDVTGYESDAAISIKSVECLEQLEGAAESEVVAGQALGHHSLLTNCWADIYVRRGSTNAKPHSLSVVTALKGSPFTHSTSLLRVSEDNYWRLVDRFPRILTKKASQLFDGISPLIHMMDSTIRLVNPKAGDFVTKEGHISDKVFVVLHGRFLSMKRSADGQPTMRDKPRHSLHSEAAIHGEHAVLSKLHRGATVGLTEFPLITVHRSAFTVKALRDGQLACMPRSILQAVISLQPEALLHLGLTMGRNLQEFLLRQQGRVVESKVSRVVTIVPASTQANVENFTHTLAETLESMDISVQILVSSLLDRIANYHNPYAKMSKFTQHQPSAIEETMLTSILNQVEDTNDIALMVVDPWVNAQNQPTWWSSYAIRQADLILYVGNAQDSPQMTVLEQRLSAVQTNARKELVLLYFEKDLSKMDDIGPSRVFPEPNGTRRWIQNRGEIHFHHHIRCSPQHLRHDVYHYKSDFRRLARWLVGRSVGIVLGGGGARGCSHLSVIRALENQGIPIDFVAGSSIGAFMGGLYAWKTDNLHMIPVVSKFSKEMSSLWKKIRDLTFPITTYFKGLAFNRSIVKVFESKKIEDLWLPFFCMSTDLTDSNAIAHRNGALWKYVRASMTLVNFMPPICDVISDTDDLENNRVHYLADGGYVNNLPVDIMREMIGPKGTVIAVDVQSDWTFAGDDYGDYLNGWWYLFMWLNPWVETPKIPTSSDIQTQLAYISSVQQGGTSNSKQIVQGMYQAESLKGHIDLFLHPPVENFGTLEFNQNREIQLIGFEYAQKKVKQWMDDLKANDVDRIKYFINRPIPSNESTAFLNKPQKRRKLNRRSLSWAKLNMGLA